MCFSLFKPKKSKYETYVQQQDEIARQEEQARQNRVKQGAGAIDSAFSGFDDNFFDGFKKTYSDYYTPQIDNQYNDALEKLTFAATRQGISGSTGENDQLANLSERRANTLGDVANDANAAAATLRGNVEDNRSQLYSFNTSAADPGRAGTQAAASARALSEAPSYNPLGQVFADLVSNGAAAYQGSQQRFPTNTSASRVPKKSSLTVVR